MKKKRISELTPHELIEQLRAKIETPVPTDSDKKEGRSEFYNTLDTLPKESQIRIIIEIFGIVAFGKSKREKKDYDYYKHLRKRYEYIRRIERKGKSPNIEPSDFTEFHNHPPHRPKGSTYKGVSYSFIRGLHRVIKEAELSNPYERVSYILYNFCGIHIETDSVKRTIIRRKDDIKELDEFEERSEKASSNFPFFRLP